MLCCCVYSCLLGGFVYWLLGVLVGLVSVCSWLLGGVVPAVVCLLLLSLLVKVDKRERMNNKT